MTGPAADGADATVDEYIGTFPDDRQQLLQLVRSAIHRGVPDAPEKIRYGMPAVMLDRSYATRHQRPTPPTPTPQTFLTPRRQ